MDNRLRQGHARGSSDGGNYRLESPAVDNYYNQPEGASRHLTGAEDSDGNPENGFQGSASHHKGEEAATSSQQQVSTSHGVAGRRLLNPPAALESAGASQNQLMQPAQLSNGLSSHNYYNQQFAGQQVPHAPTTGQPPLGVGNQVYPNLNVHPSAQRAGAPVLSQSMDQSFMLDANNVINAIMQ